MKQIASILCVSVLTYGIAPELLANDSTRTGGFSGQEEREFAALEAQSPEAAQFEGGSALGVTLTILLIIGLVVVIWWLLEHNHHHRTHPLAAELKP